MSRSRLRVLAVTNLWPYDGDPSHGAFVAAQMESVKELGVEIDVVFVNGRANAFAYLFGAIRMLALNFRRSRYDLIHAHTGHCAVLARLQVKYPVVVSYVGYDVYGNVRADGSITLKSRIEGAVFRQLAHLVSATITKSSRMEVLLPARTRERNTVLPNGVDRSVFYERPRAIARQELGLPADELIVLFAGRTDFARKRIGVARAACDLVSREIPNVRLRICERLPHSFVPVWMSAADVLLLPSLAEGSPNVVKEALACNLPVVATDTGDVAEVLAGVDRSHALPIDATAEDFAAVLIDVLRAAPARSNGRACTDRLDARVIARRLNEIYLALARVESGNLSKSTAGDLDSF